MPSIDGRTVEPVFDPLLVGVAAPNPSHVETVGRASVTVDGSVVTEYAGYPCERRVVSGASVAGAASSWLHRVAGREIYRKHALSGADNNSVGSVGYHTHEICGTGKFGDPLPSCVPQAESSQVLI
jgi:hypothetical protein